MYYILYEGLKIESNEPVYCTVYTVQCTHKYQRVPRLDAVLSTK